jgi:hypothetical protein
VVNPEQRALLFGTTPAFVVAPTPSTGTRMAVVRSILRQCVDWAVVRRLLSLSEHDPVDPRTRMATLCVYAHASLAYCKTRVSMIRGQEVMRLHLADWCLP